MMETVHKLLPRASLQVCTPYTHAEEGVASKEHFLALDIEDDATWRVAWRVEHLQLMTAKGNQLAVGQLGAQGGHLPFVRDAEESRHLLAHVLVDEVVGLMQPRPDAELFVEGVEAENVVEVGMGTQHVAQGETVVLDVLRDGLALVAEEGSAVDDHGLLRLVVHDETILLNGITYKCLDVDHSGR